ncbi:hypothetical protein [Priestia filamentosa]|uniref:hypothetical protein n=1 Tax=Priestia filamentosa TaxID=1402861 RepID=UPI0013143B95|nr:hypothetical protein [Priestia filamentosa]
MHNDENESAYYGKVMQPRLDWYLANDEDISKVKLIFSDVTNFDSGSTLHDKK